MMYANYIILRKAQTLVSFFWHQEKHALLVWRFGDSRLKVIAICPALKHAGTDGN